MHRFGVLLLLLLVACSDGRGGGVTGGSRDAGPSFDAGRDAGTPRAFALTAPVDTTFEVDPTGPTTQIHADVARGADAVWIAYSRPSDDGTTFFDVFVTAFGGDGAVKVPPVRLNEVREKNDLDPAIAISGDRVMVAWQRDSQTATMNLDIVYRILATDGAPVGGEHVLATTRDGAPVEDNIWFPKLTPAPGGGFTLAGAWGDDRVNAFVLFTTSVDRDGVAAPAGTTVHLPESAHQENADLVYGADGALRVAWDEDGRTYHGTFDGALTPADPPLVFAGADTGAPSLAIDADGDAWIAVHVERRGGADILVKPADEHGATSSPIWFGEAGEVDLLPAIAFGPTGGAVFWYRRISGARFRLFVAPIDDPSAAEEISTDVAAAPYGATLVHIVDDVYFAAWADGANPNYRVRGRFIDLAN